VEETLLSQCEIASVWVKKKVDYVSDTSINWLLLMKIEYINTKTHKIIQNALRKLRKRK
jgi:hypothetical protein